MPLKKLVTNSFSDDAVSAAKLDNAVVTDINTGVSNSVPPGGIIMWSGTTIPTGWALCDGENDTPDLRNRFIVGANDASQAATTTQAGPAFNADTGVIASTYTPGDIGGETAHQLTVAEMPSHSHSYNRANIYRQGSGPNAQTDMANDGGTPQTGSTGGDDYHENRPPYYALAFIMKL